MTTTPVVRRCFSLGCLLGLSALAGCAGGARVAGYRLDPSPEMDRLALEKAEEENIRALTQDTNLRALNDDVARFWLYDRPTRLTPRRTPY